MGTYDTYRSRRLSATLQYLFIFPNTWVVWIDAWHSIEEHLSCVSLHSGWGASGLNGRLNTQRLVDPLQQVPDEESLLELSTAPETQVEHLEREGEVVNAFIFSTHPCFIYWQKVVDSISFKLHYLLHLKEPPLSLCSAIRVGWLFT